ncbi:hypothetical protein AB4Y45_32165 [Paraburkholderia sp. EG287A]|uniref:hypothetical protein n=1 Tax=Paraburkholderia sp. EG287A TaxID=3237012 RepID=UPI0034D389E3
MLPPLEFLMEQANLLIAYMGDKHRFRLRAASSLEALAAIYRVKDWNTLKALAERAERPQRAREGAPQERYPLDWGPYGERMHVPRVDWQRHVLAEGGSVEKRRAWLQRHLAGQVERSGAGVFVNIFGGAITAAERAALSDHAQVLDLSSGHGPACNVFADMPVELVAEMVMAALRPRLSGDVFWYARVMAAITTVLKVSEATGACITLSSLSFDVKQLAYDCGRALLAASPPGDARAAAQALFDSLRGGAAADSMRRLLVEAAEDLDELQRTPGIEGLFAASARAPSLLSLVQAPQCLVVEMAAQDSERAVRVQGAALQYVVREAVSRSIALPRDAREPHPRVIALSEGHRYLEPAFGRVLEQGRSAGWTALVTIPDDDSLRQISSGFLGITGNVWNRTALSLVGNVWNRVYLGGLPQHVLDDVIARMQVADSVVVSPNGVQFSS